MPEVVHGRREKEIQEEKQEDKQARDV